jgi:hypothetical protein
LNAAVLVVHHTGKDGKIRGSTALYAAADCVLAVTAADGRITIDNEPDKGGKNKHAAALPPKHLRLQPHEVHGFNGAVLVKDEASAPAFTGGLTRNQQEIVEALIGEVNGLTAYTIIEVTGASKSAVYRNLKQLVQVGRIYQVEDRYFFGPQPGSLPIPIPSE